jgi:Ca2+-transporting ATPase
LQKSDYYKGLRDEEVLQSRQLHGSNIIGSYKKSAFWRVLKEIALEPMFGVLLAACFIYFAVRQYQEGTIMLIAILIVSGISFFQEYRSRKAVRALQQLSAGKVTAIRDGVNTHVPPGEIVVDDIILLQEGEVVPADGIIISANDLSLNESTVTGESFSVTKSSTDVVFGGTQVTSGAGLIKVTAVGPATQLGKIGKAVTEANVVKTPLQLQIRSFVRNMLWIGGIAFIVVVVYNFIQSGDLLQSFLSGLTLAMSVLPEEIPVAFSTFQALGAYRLLRNNVIVRQPQYVETLGSATVICTDKTGTITKNEMSIEYLYDAATLQQIHVKASNLPPELIAYAMWSSETMPFDPMEKAIHDLYARTCTTDQRLLWRQVHEYPIGGKPPFMTHIFRNNSGEILIASKGAPEAILRQSILSDQKKTFFSDVALGFAKQGYRVLAVGKASWKKTEWPSTQQQFNITFLGLVIFSDPPKENIAETLQSFFNAGIKVKMITGDYPETALSIARAVNMENTESFLIGEDVLKMSAEKLEHEVVNVDIYARMFPEAKVKVVDALKANGEVVAMTGDGVNDAPALRSAHIGIAMGKRGSEVAKHAAALILTDDDLKHMTEAVALGRKIYDNLKKAIQYIVSIHIPIILIVIVPLLLMWEFTNIFTPVHVIFLELLMGPTCSIIYENEPMEPGTMFRPPRKLSQTFLSGSQLLISIIQGGFIATGCLGLGYYFLVTGHSEDTVRTVVFVTLLFSNIFLTFVNRSFRFSILQTFRYSNPLLIVIIGLTLTFIGMLLYVPQIRDLFRLQMLPTPSILLCLLVAAVGTLWIEISKVGQWKRGG